MTLVYLMQSLQYQDFQPDTEICRYHMHQTQAWEEFIVVDIHLEYSKF